MRPSHDNVINALADSDTPMCVRDIANALGTGQTRKVRGIVIDLLFNEQISRINKSYYKLREMSHKSPEPEATRKQRLPTELAAKKNREKRTPKLKQKRIHVRSEWRFLHPSWPKP